MQFNSLTNFQKEILYKAYEAYKVNPMSVPRYALLSEGVKLDLGEDDGRHREYNELLNEFIYHHPVGNTVYYWLNDAGVSMMNQTL